MDVSILAGPMLARIRHELVVTGHRLLDIVDDPYGTRNVVGQVPAPNDSSAPAGPGAPSQTPAQPGAPSQAPSRPGAPSQGPPRPGPSAGAPGHGTQPRTGTPPGVTPARPVTPSPAPPIRTLSPETIEMIQNLYGDFTQPRTYDDKAGIIMRDWDSNRDGMLTIDGFLGIGNENEQAGGLFPSLEIGKGNSIKSFTQAADAAGDRNGKVSRDELARELQRRDANRDGWVEHGEVDWIDY